MDDKNSDRASKRDVAKANIMKRKGLNGPKVAGREYMRKREKPFRAASGRI